MHRIARFAVLVASLTSLAATMAATADAITWDNRGSTAFTATNTSTGTLSVTGVNLVCHSATATGTAPNNVVATVYTISGSISYSPCSLSGLPTILNCIYGFTTTSSGPTTFTGNSDTFCSLTQFGTELCKIEGQEPAAYHNPHGGAARLTLFHSTTLRTTNGSGGNCILGVGEAVTMKAETYTHTSANPPTLVRTP